MGACSVAKYTRVRTLQPPAAHPWPTWTLARRWIGGRDRQARPPARQVTATLQHCLRVTGACSPFWLNGRPLWQQHGHTHRATYFLSENGLAYCSHLQCSRVRWCVRAEVSHTPHAPASGRGASLCQSHPRSSPCLVFSCSSEGAYLRVLADTQTVTHTDARLTDT